MYLERAASYTRAIAAFVILGGIGAVLGFVTGVGLGRLRRGAWIAGAVGLALAAAYYAYLVANPQEDCHHCSDALGVHGDPLALFALAANLLAWLIAAPLGALVRRRRGRTRA